MERGSSRSWAGRIGRWVAHAIAGWGTDRNGHPSDAHPIPFEIPSGRNDARIRLLESAVVHARDAIVILEALPSGGRGRSVLYVNDAFCRMTGYDAREVIGRSLHFLRGPRSDPDTLDRIRDALSAGAPLLIELLNYRKDGTEYWVELSLVPVPDAAGICAHWVMIQRDISGRKRAEEALRQSEELFRGIFENAAAGVTLTDALGRFVAVNPAFAALLGRSPDELVGRSPGDFTDPADWADQWPVHQDMLSGARDNYQYRKRYVRADGSEVWTELSVAAVRDQNGAFLYGLGVTVDLTDRLRLEEHLRQAQRMESVGQLAGGIAHDFNNLLTGVLGNLALIDLPAGDPNRARVATAERAANRAAELTRKLLGFARKNQLMVAAVRVEDVVTEVVDILRHTFDPRIEIAVELNDRDRVSADATLLNQALMNLCLNARDAMPEGGRLSIRTETVTVATEAAATNPDARPGSFVRLTVEDTGSGMPAEVRARVFEPFFTTKPVGHGTGLGLAMVHGIVRQHHGWLACDSAPGRGTRFEVYLPVAGPPAGGSVGVRRVATERRLPADTTMPPPGGAGSHTILLVDDEELIRELGRSVLESAGYRVLEAGDGADAIEVFRREHEGITLVVLDLMMPRVSGRDTFHAMTAIAPDVRVLFSSGYSTDDLSDVTGSLGMLAKPYRPNELLAAVRSALATLPTASASTGP